MKIVSLQSVGLGATYTRGDYEQISAPYEIHVGTTFLNSAGNSLDVTVTEIVKQTFFDGLEFQSYLVITSDGHIRVLPADKYIAEWSE